MSDVKQAGVGINWDLANNDAADWALNHSGEMVRGILGTTQDQIRREVSNFTQNQETINQLGKRLEGSFSPERANMIAVTEVTRSYAEGSRIAWQESGVVDGRRWNTANDELVCPICGPLDGTMLPLNVDFEYGGPPAHPRCRCWVTPVEIGVSPTGAELFAEPGMERVFFAGPGTPYDPLLDAASLGMPAGWTPATSGLTAAQAQEIALMDSIETYDPFAKIRPPAGRAPRGMGVEYKQRQRIVNRIDTQIKYRNIAQAELDKYRGQTSQRLRWKFDVAQTRVQELNKGITSMLDIAGDPYSDWGFKNELIDGIIGHISGLRRLVVEGG